MLIAMTMQLSGASSRKFDGCVIMDELCWIQGQKFENRERHIMYVTFLIKMC